ncbi:MAG: TldD/PmbA family protein [Candidatus Schekmanbacteria bacterium]|nr:TldD/PmbA family protein [Candidatus Schekmanbacteria bacterium]
MDEIKLAREIIGRLEKKGIQEAEVWIEKAQATGIDIKEQKVDTFKLTEEDGIGLRIINNQRIGFSFCSERNQAAIDQLINHALSAALSGDPDEYYHLPRLAASYPQVPGKDPDLVKVNVRDKIERAKEIERAAYAYDKRVDKVRHTTYSDSQYEVWIANNHGLELYYDGGLCSLSILAVATEGADSQTGWEFDLARRYQDLAASQKIGESAARMSVSLLGAQIIGTRRTAIIFDNYTAHELLGMFSHAFSADAVQKGKSLLIGKEGKQIASPLININDDGLKKDAFHSAPADGEGVPMQTTPLVKDGVLVGLLHNSYTAAKARTASTGNGMRGGFKSLPDVDVSNFFLAPGTIGFEQLLAGTGEGLLVTQLMGTHTCDPISGDFSVGAMGLWLEQGQKTKPVRGVTIAGNFLELLVQVDAVADNLRFFGSVGTPAFRCRDIMLGGE